MGELERNERLITPEDLEAEGIPEEVIKRIMGIVAVEQEVEIAQPTLF